MRHRPKHRRRRRTRTGPQRAVIAVNAVACITCLGLAAALTWTNQRVQEIPRLELGEQLAAQTEGAGPSGRAKNFLVIGTDSADGLPEDDPVRIGRDAGVRTDTLMIVRIDPASEQAAVLSLPRDLYVPIAGTGGSGRINGAVQGEGPARLLATINDALDIPIHHYVEIDFEGFRELVAAVGGVPVYFPEPVRDRSSGLSVPSPGCVTLDPGQALAYARSRAYEVHRDGRWETDPTGDLGRISRQQDFIRRVLHRAFQRGARNPTVLFNLIDAGVQAVNLDGDLKLGELREMAGHFRQFDPNELVTYNLPVFDAVAGGAAVLRLDVRRAQPVLDVFRGEDPTRVAPDNTVVQVLNGTPSAGLAEEVAEDLRALGFVVPPEATDVAESFDVATTTVLYLDGSEERAALVASALGADPAVQEERYVVGADVAIVIGADWPGVASALRQQTPGLVPAGRPTATTSTTPRATTGGTVAERSTTTTVIGEVPESVPEAC